jgi:hypothetical protein
VYEYIITAKNGRLLVAKLEAFEDDEIEEVKANAELICKAVNAYGKPKMFPQSPVPIPSDEYIEKCVNNYERLIDSNRELLAILEQEAWLGNINLDKHIAAISKAKAIL